MIVTSVSYSSSKIAGNETTTEQPMSYQITDGTCGEVIFKEQVGTDSLSAVETIRQRNVIGFSDILDL